MVTSSKRRYRFQEADAATSTACFLKVRLRVGHRPRRTARGEVVLRQDREQEGDACGLEGVRVATSTLAFSQRVMSASKTGKEKSRRRAPGGWDCRVPRRESAVNDRATEMTLVVSFG